MVYTRKWKKQQRRPFIQLNESLSDFVIVGNANVFVVGNGVLLESQASGHYINPERSVDVEIKACQNQITGNIIDEKYRKAVDNAVKTLKTCLHDAILTAMHNVVNSPSELTMRLITESSEHGTNSVLQNQDRRDSSGNRENTPLKSAFS